MGRRDRRRLPPITRRPPLNPARLRPPTKDRNPPPDATVGSPPCPNPKTTSTRSTITSKQQDHHRCERGGLGRLVDKTYFSKTFSLGLTHSSDYGQPARAIWKVFDDPEAPDDDAQALEEAGTMNLTPAGRKQLTIEVAREAGRVREIRLDKVVHTGGKASLENVLRLDRDAANRFLALVRGIEHIPIEGERGGRVDDAALAEIFNDPQALERLYSRDPEAFRAVIASDASADDLVALEGRRKQVERFRELLEDDDAFEAATADAKGSPERVWQRFLEENPWILGVTLAGQLMTSYDSEKLEQTVAGFNAWQSGKRVDALMRTAGAIRSLVFAEIKHHKTDLMGSDYRKEVWLPSAEVSGGVVQVQQTVHRAVAQIAEGARDVGEDGTDTGALTYAFRPRSYLIVGHLSEMLGEHGGVHHEKHRSFELFRRNLVEPEIVTFDELLARAEWHVLAASGSPASGTDAEASTS